MDQRFGIARVRECREYGFVDIDREDILRPDGTLDVAAEVQNLNAFTVDFKDSTLRLQAGGFVGVLPINERLVLRITPRTPMPNLTTMVERSGYAPLPLQALRGYSTTKSTSDWLLDTYADQLIRDVEMLLSGGMLRTYRREFASGSRPHGHLEISQTIRAFASRGVKNKAHYSWFERTVDNAPNRCLKGAMLVLHRVYTGRGRGKPGSAKRVRDLARVLRSFEDVSVDTGHRFLGDPMVAGLRPPPATRSYYQSPLRIAVAVITGRGVSLDLRAGDLSLPSMLLNMGDLFEEYVRTTLQSHAARDGWDAKVLDGNVEGAKSLYSPPPDETMVGGNRLVPKSQASRTGGPPKVTPDIVVERDSEAIVVGEIKNTMLKSDLPAREEVEQVLTYALRYGTTKALLVHPRGRAHQRGLHFVGQVGDVDVFDYRYDLGASDLAAEDTAFATAVSDLIRFSRVPTKLEMPAGP